MRTKNRILTLSGVCAGLLALATSCANIGTPSGGPRDENPPRLVKASPMPGSKNVSNRKITIDFDELVNVRDAFQNVVVSPTNYGIPRVSSLGRRVTLDFDSLAPNTTYTVDFGDAIEDNNEGNKLQGFSYTFSTGANLDSLRISGRVMDARNLEPRQGILVGVHSNLEDSAFTSQRFLRVARTDDRGQFTIRGLAPGKYRVFALGDIDNDFKYSTPDEDIAFYDLIVQPSSRSTVATDSIWNPLTGLLDSVSYRERTQFLPNDILLRTFNSEIRAQYLTKYERLDSTRIFLKFNTRASSLPELSIPSLPALASIGTLDATSRLDSLVYWLRPELMKRDSLTIVARYFRADAGKEPELVSDTLQFNTLRQKASKKSSKKKRITAADSIAAITMAFTPVGATSQDVDRPLYFESKVPPASFDLEGVHLSVKRDSVFVPIEDGWSVSQADSLNPRRFMVEYPWEYGASYRLEIDTLAARSIYGLPSRPLELTFNTKEEAEYCSLTFRLSGIPAHTDSFVELLSGSDAVVATSPVENNTASFPFLAPGKYYARIILDTNGNGEFDTGSYADLRQPDLAYYYPKAITLKKLWNKDESWNIFSTPVDKMKPSAVLKNKPKADTRVRYNPKSKSSTPTDEEEDL